ncbi:TetR/AcrR family transcriptional regulator [Rhodococcus kronopolitis]|uniref:TetR/AcrR family transcriptional regulator n=1 Tax=Rhodococcus kronopolitis TaxID=1460226 RepID=A0ABV9FR65_9NOCA
MASDTGRHARIADAVLDIVAAEGIRALTHRAVDRHLGLPNGSTSYYFRTKRELLVAAVEQLNATSRRDFERSRLTRPPAELPALAELARDIGAALDAMLVGRVRDIRARYALTLEMVNDKEIQQALATSIFSQPLGAALVRDLGSADPEVDGANFVALCEGLVWERSVGAQALTGPAPGSAASARELTAAVATYLRGVAAGR